MDRASAEARRGFDGPEVGTIAPSGRRTVSGAARSGVGGCARKVSRTIWDVMAADAHEQSPDVSRYGQSARASRVPGGSRANTRGYPDID